MHSYYGDRRLPYKQMVDMLIYAIDDSNEKDMYQSWVAKYQHPFMTEEGFIPFSAYKEMLKEQSRRAVTLTEISDEEILQEMDWVVQQFEESRI